MSEGQPQNPALTFDSLNTAFSRPLRIKRNCFAIAEVDAQVSSAPAQCATCCTAAFTLMQLRPGFWQEGGRSHNAGHRFAQVLVFSYWSFTVSANTKRHLRLPCLLKAITQKPMVLYWLRRAYALWQMWLTHLHLRPTHRSGQTTGTHGLCLILSRAAMSGCTWKVIL